MPATIERPAARTDRRRRGIGAFIGALAATAALVPLALALDDGGRVGLVVVNGTDLDLGVELRRPDGARLPVVHVKADSRRVVEEVLHDGGDLDVVWTHDGQEVGRASVAPGQDLVAPAIE